MDYRLGQKKTGFESIELGLSSVQRSRRSLLATCLYIFGGCDTQIYVISLTRLCTATAVTLRIDLIDIGHQYCMYSSAYRYPPLS